MFEFLSSSRRPPSTSNRRTAGDGTFACLCNLNCVSTIKLNRQARVGCASERQAATHWALSTTIAVLFTFKVAWGIQNIIDYFGQVVGVRMSTIHEVPRAEQTKTEKTADLTKGIARFAQYTSPVMLAMLASAGKDAALAATAA